MFQPVLQDWCNKGCGICYPVYGMMHIKEPLLLLGKSHSYDSNGFPLSLSEWSFLMPYNRKCVECISFLDLVILHRINSRSSQCSTMCTKGHGMCYPVCGMVHIKEPLLNSERVAHVVAAGFLSHYLSGPSPYNRK